MEKEAFLPQKSNNKGQRKAGSQKTGFNYRHLSQILLFKTDALTSDQMNFV